jgi:penicillin-binding protein 2
VRSDGPRLRLGLLGVVAVSLFAALFARLWYLQVLASPEYQLQATALQRREVIEPAPRGRILDRNGVVLVDNQLSYVVSLDRQLLGELEDGERADLLGRLLTRLAPAEPTLTIESLEQRLASDRFSPYTPVPVADDVPEQLAVWFTEHRDEFDGVVQVDARAVRHYPYGRLASHVVGYVGSINDEEFAAAESADPGEYQLTDEIGKAGVERTYEAELRGEPGRRVLEVDAEGNTVGELSYEPPVAGHDIVLSIDITVQAMAEQALREELARARERRVSGDNPPNLSPAGSVVVTDVNDGSVVAMASFPDFDPSTFVDGIDDTEWAALTWEGSFNPLLNRAIQGEYAPGSTFKMITAYGGLASGMISPEYVWRDAGVYTVPNCRGESCRFRNAGSRAYGNVDLREALTVSSDTYFYDIGARMWFARDQVGDPIQDAALLFGLGADTGVPLPNERSGRVMTPEEYAARSEENPTAFPDGEWQAGDNVNLAIGQGEMLVTPLQLVNAYATLANGGTLHAPNIVREVRVGGTDEVVRTYEPRVVRQIEFPPEWRQALLDGFIGVTTSGDGTAFGTFGGFPNWVIAGKTGTAEVAGKADTAIFVGFGPAQAPQYAAAAFLEESGFGGVAAAPLVRRILEPLALGTPPAVQAGVAPFGYVVTLPEQADPFAGGDVVD